MVISEVSDNPKRFLDLLLIGDEQESLLDQYIQTGTMFVLSGPEVRACCVVTDAGNDVLEIRNISVYPRFQRMGYGRLMIQFLEERYRSRFHRLRAGTGDSPLTVPFYQRLGFHVVSRIPNYFPEHYDHPIREGGTLLTDLIYFEKEL